MFGEAIRNLEVDQREISRLQYIIETLTAELAKRTEELNTYRVAFGKEPLP